jgi:hypothetical protein
LLTNRKKLAIASAALVVVALFVAAWSKFRDRPFEQGAWLAAERRRSAIRLKMADHLVADRALLGKTREEIEALLGPPSQRGFSEPGDMTYWLGPERSLISVDSEWLIVRFDSAARVRECAINTD